MYDGKGEWMRERGEREGGWVGESEIEMEGRKGRVEGVRRKGR